MVPSYECGLQVSRGMRTDIVVVAAVAAVALVHSPDPNWLEHASSFQQLQLYQAHP